MARVRVDANDVAQLFRPGGSVELLRLNQGEPTGMQRAEHTLDFAKKLYPIAGGIGKVIATGIGALSRPGGQQPLPVPMGDPEALRQQAAQRLLEQQQQPQAPAQPQAAAPTPGVEEARQAMSFRMAGDSPQMPQGAEPLRPELMRRIEADQAAGIMPERPPVSGVDQVHDETFHPERPHFDPEDMRRYADLQKALPKAPTPSIAQRIIGEMQALQTSMIDKSKAPEAQPEMQVEMAQTPAGTVPTVRLPGGGAVLQSPDGTGYAVVGPDGKVMARLTQEQANQMLQQKPQRAGLQGVLQQAMPQRTGPDTQEGLLAEAFMAQTPEQRANILSRAQGVDVYSGDLLDLLTGSTEARKGFINQIGTAMHGVRAGKTAEELDKLRAESERERAMAGYYGSRPTTEQAKLEARGKELDLRHQEREADRKARIDTASAKLAEDKAKREAAGVDRAAALQQKRDAFMDTLKLKQEELKAKKAGIGAWKKTPMQINIDARTLTGAKELHAAARKVLDEHETDKRDLQKKIAELPVSVPPEPKDPLESMSERERMVADPKVLEERVQAYAKQRADWERRSEEAARRSELQKQLQELQAKEADPESEIGQAKQDAKLATDAMKRSGRIK